MPSIDIRSSAVCALVALTACNPVSYKKAGKPLTYERSAPENACERANWVEIIPTRVRSSRRDSTGGQHYSTVRTASGRLTGLGLYRPGGNEPLELDEGVLRSIDASVAQAHEEKLSGTRGRISGMWWSAGITIAGSGLIIPGAIVGGDTVPGAAMLITGTVAAVGGLIAFFVVRPSPSQRVELDLRERVLVNHEDNLEAVTKGVIRHNQAVRARCAQ